MVPLRVGCPWNCFQMFVLDFMWAPNQDDYARRREHSASHSGPEKALTLLGIIEKPSESSIPLQGVSGFILAMGEWALRRRNN